MVLSGNFRCSGKIKSTLRTLLRVAVVALTLCGVRAQALDWGSVITAYSTTDADSLHAATLDQQYTVNATGTLAPTLSYFGAVRFRHLQVAERGSSANWLTELNPSASAVWALPLIRLSSDYSHRQNRDRRGNQDLKARAAGVYAQTTWQKLPMLQGYYNWNQNLNDLDLLGADTRQQTIGASGSYSAKASTVRYDYGNTQTRSPATGLEQNSQHHAASFDNNLHLWKQALSLQTNYRVTARRDRERKAGSDAVLLPLTPLTGLYLADPDPEFGTLEGLSALSDGNLDSVASRQINLSDGEVHNIGLDLGSAAEIDRLFLYTDTLANPDVRWAVYTSLDNVTWTRTRDYRRDPYSDVFLRYEVEFDRLTARYVKLVLAPSAAGTGRVRDGTPRADHAARPYRKASGARITWHPYRRASGR